LTNQQGELEDYIKLRCDYIGKAYQILGHRDGIALLNGLHKGYLKLKHFFDTSDSPQDFQRTVKHWLVVELSRSTHPSVDIYDIGLHLAGQDVLAYWFTGKPLFPVHDIVNILMSIDRQGLVEQTQEAMKKQIRKEDLVL
jgi:hypothetical protein